MLRALISSCISFSFFLLPTAGAFIFVGDGKKRNAKTIEQIMNL